jgi:hypothetical protein
MAMLANARAGDAALTTIPRTVFLGLIILLMPYVPEGGGSHAPVRRIIVDGAARHNTDDINDAAESTCNKP